ncbi:hypothetical protein ACFU3E_16905 [Streptomyces sp. NPDC057424]|uniref:hypothetical protein n=1 Tax=Streptomyces sp. NPDC057424 TaxID=3346127 RepID=UPI003677F266
MSTTRTASKPADNEPFDFNLDAVQAEVDLTPWRVHWNSRRWEFQHSEALDVWELMEGAERGEIGATVGIFKLALGEEQYTEFRKVKMPQFKMKALFEGYKKHCGLGESQASSDS